MTELIEIKQDIAALVTAAGNTPLDWKIIKELNKVETFPYGDLTDAELEALRAMCNRQSFIADMADNYKTACAEKKQIRPIMVAVLKERDERRKVA